MTPQARHHHAEGPNPVLSKNLSSRFPPRCRQYMGFMKHMRPKKKKLEIYDGPTKGELPAQYDFFRPSAISRVAKLRLWPAQMRV